jgi:hypothetical protein
MSGTQVKLACIGILSVGSFACLVGCSAPAEAGSGGQAGSGQPSAGSATSQAGGGGTGTSGSSQGGASNAGTSASAGATGSTAGAPAGSAGSGGGAGGTASGGGASGAAGAAGAGGGTGGASGAGGGAPGGGAGACPPDATFCSGFEDSALPPGAVYKVNAAPGDWNRDFAIDTTVFRGGKSALRVKAGTEAGTSGSAYQMLAVPAPSGAFWVRFYIRQDELDIGGVGHNVFAGASDSDEPNAAVMVELAEDVGFSFNNKDDVRWPMGFGRINGVEKPFTLPKGMWHCVEVSYDSAKQQQQAYVGGTLQIDATNYPAAATAAFKTFKFGFNKLHGPGRSIWYDDVVVAPTRPGC